MRYLGEFEAKEFLRGHGLPVNPTYRVDALQDALQKAEEMGYPVVLKVLSHKVIHKSNVGGVLTGIDSAKRLEEVFESFKEKMKALDQHASVTIQPHLPQGIELAVGISMDPSFGKVIMFGLGGIWIEVLKDVTFRLVPIEEKDAWQMIDEIKGKRILEGVRGYPAVDKEALARFLVDVSDVAQRRGITEMDLNPVFAWEKRLLIADARLVMGE